MKDYVPPTVLGTGPDNQNTSSQGNEMLTESGRVEHKDRKVTGDVAEESFVNCLFIRLVAKRARFTNVDFRYTIFDACYLRECRFDSCTFVGCRFISCNFYGSRFSGCQFDYATFERTIVDSDILDNSCPAFDNLRLKFARTLRMNFQQLGDSTSVNKAIGVELQATESHLYKSWNSNESYYRHKYAKWSRFAAFIRWGQFKFLDLVWGNGESAWKLTRSVACLLGVVTLIDVFTFRNPWDVGDYLSAGIIAPQLLLGTAKDTSYWPGYLAALVLMRLIAMNTFTRLDQFVVVTSLLTQMLTSSHLSMDTNHVLIQVSFRSTRIAESASFGGRETHLLGICHSNRDCYSRQTTSISSGLWGGRPLIATARRTVTSSIAYFRMLTRHWSRRKIVASSICQQYS
jgi:hypothetical protein